MGSCYLQLARDKHALTISITLLGSCYLQLARDKHVQRLENIHPAEMAATSAPYTLYPALSPSPYTLYPTLSPSPFTLSSPSSPYLAPHTLTVSP